MTTEGMCFEVGSFQGEVGMAKALERCIVYACEQGSRTLCFCDVGFAQWPLSNDRVIDAMTGWARSVSNQRRLTVMAATYGLIEREHNVWMRWRRTWGHRVQCLVVASEFDANLPCVFWSDGLMLSVQNRDTCVGGVSQDRKDLVAMRLRLDELVRCCAEGFPATTLDTAVNRLM